MRQELTMEPTSAPIIPLSHPATTAKLLSLLETESLSGKRFLDVGAGEGYLSWQLCDFLEKRGYDGPAVISACDLFPEEFKFDKIECQLADFGERIPLDDESFDYVISMEVIEHVPNQLHLIRELHRLVKPGGKMMLTTPNVLNLNSRVRSLFTGTMPLFDLLPIAENDIRNVSGHIAPISLYYLYFFAKLAGFREVHFHIDRVKRSAMVFSPPFYVASRICQFFHDRQRRNLSYWEENAPAARAMNQWQTFVGRTLIVEAIK